MEQISFFIASILSKIPSMHIPTIKLTYVVEIIIISFLVYQIMLWVKNTKAWSLLKGVVIIVLFILIAAIFEMNTIIWIASNAFSLGIMAVIVVLQPELRKALEELGKKNIVMTLFPLESSKKESGLFSDKTINEISKACVEMSQVKTGALIVVQQYDSLKDYEETGIAVDAIITSQLLINIFEHNTPLHDGAVMISGDRISAATCYLPLSDNNHLSKALGTRHRAGVGISEATDSMTIIVSEETGKISIAYKGDLYRGLRGEEIQAQLVKIQNKVVMEKNKRNWKVIPEKVHGSTENESKGKNG
ncbi:MAG: diadenylate cyclase CdaA [Eubacteriales bacterium]